MSRFRPVDDPDQYRQGEAETLAGVLRHFEQLGYSAQFAARERGAVVCFTCRTETPADRLEVVEVRRLEGASDPDDMNVVAAIACPACGARGTLVLGYGPNADDDDAGVLLLLPDADEEPQPTIAETEELVVGPAPSDFAFAFDDPWIERWCSLFGIRRTNCWVRVGPTELEANYGRWRVTTPLANIAGAELSGPYSALKVGGPARLSIVDRGLTFATTRTRGVCIRFRTPVSGVEPIGLLRHPGLTVTVDDPDGLVLRIGGFDHTLPG
jgi:hypothetical protein